MNLDDIKKLSSAAAAKPWRIESKPRLRAAPPPDRAEAPAIAITALTVRRREWTSSAR